MFYIKVNKNSLNPLQNNIGEGIIKARF